MPERRVTCHVCSRTLTYDDVLPRGSTCESCGADLRCCRNCAFYDPTAYNECSEPSAERVLDKDRANFCDYFTARAQTGGGEQSADSGAKAELDRLFGKK
jgi:hypothetical protein